MVRFGIGIVFLLYMLYIFFPAFLRLCGFYLPLLMKGMDTTAICCCLFFGFLFHSNKG